MGISSFYWGLVSLCRQKIVRAPKSVNAVKLTIRVELAYNLVHYNYGTVYHAHIDPCSSTAVFARLTPG